MRKSIAIAFIAICLAGCGMADAVVNGMKHSAAVETAIKEATGVKPSVGFNWNNGHLTSVTVTFPQLYDTKPLRDVAEIAREAVVTGLNLDAIERLGDGNVMPGCFLLSPNVPGHAAGARCPYGTPGHGNLAKARALLRRSGMAGQPVSVWTQTRQPTLQWMTYYAQYLNSLGFKATLKEQASATYWSTIGQ